MNVDAMTPAICESTQMNKWLPVLAFFIAKVLDIRGALGVPGTGGSVPGAFWGALALSLVTGFFFVHGLVRPRVVEGLWAPMVRIPTGGDVDLIVATAGLAFRPVAMRCCWPS